MVSLARVFLLEEVVIVVMAPVLEVEQKMDTWHWHQGTDWDKMTLPVAAPFVVEELAAQIAVGVVRIVVVGQLVVGVVQIVVAVPFAEVEQFAAVVVARHCSVGVADIAVEFARVYHDEQQTRVWEF